MTKAEGVVMKLCTPSPPLTGDTGRQGVEQDSLAMGKEKLSASVVSVSQESLE